MLRFAPQPTRAKGYILKDYPDQSPQQNYLQIYALPSIASCLSTFLCWQLSPGLFGIQNRIPKIWFVLQVLTTLALQK
jgi:hypothetical protein